MNVILLEPEDFVSATRVRLSGRRLQHVRGVLGAAVGDELHVGEVEGKLGRGRVLALDESALELEVTLDRAPPAALPIQLVVALPRPPSLRKVLQQATAMGVKQLWLIHSRRVEKSYWQSTALAEHALREQLLLGLEQAGDTRLPRIEQRTRFKPFVEDELRAIVGSGALWVADPSAAQRCPRDPGGSHTVVVGPEGGFSEYELERLCAQGATPVGLGERVLRVETAVVALLARLAR